MMQLPALNPEERAYLQSALPNNPLQALSERLRRHLTVSLGEAVSASASQVGAAPDQLDSDEPVIRVDHVLALAWLSVRFGGKPHTVSSRVKEGALIDPFRMLIRRALAETVINNDHAAWPVAMRLQINIGQQQGNVEIFWNSARAMPWAHRAIREKP